MSRPKSHSRTINKHFSLPEDIVARLELELFSEAEGRVPVGAQAELVTALLRKHFEQQDAARKESNGN